MIVFRYIRDTVGPKQAFKYMVLIDVFTEDVPNLLAVTQRLRVERWSGYICLYAPLSLDR